LQQYFQDAVSTNDLATLRQKIVARDRKLQETKQELERLKIQLAQQNMQIRSHQQMALINQQSALSSSLAWQVSSGWIKPVSLSFLWTGQGVDTGVESVWFQHLVVA
jgi:septal ring factor EnvC (AmiA/AmiB activator)